MFLSQLSLSTRPAAVIFAELPVHTSSLLQLLLFLQMLLLVFGKVLDLVMGPAIGPRCSAPPCFRKLKRVGAYAKLSRRFL